MCESGPSRRTSGQDKFHISFQSIPEPAATPSRLELASPHGSVGIVTLTNTLTPVAQLFIDCAREEAKPLSVGKSVSGRRRL
jgi:hypothetical protein